jgi:two-component system response regulator FixJ
VFIVDDDDALRQALRHLLETAGLRVESYADGPAFLAACSADCAGCVVLDMAMPGMDGRQVHAALKERGVKLPVLFLTGHGDVPMAVQSLQAGALDFLEKPVKGAELLEGVRRGLALDDERRSAENRRREIRQRCERLTPRERQVMELVVAGLANKEIARDLDLSPRTVEVHRAHVMHKMGAASLVELVSLAGECED